MHLHVHVPVPVRVLIDVQMDTEEKPTTTPVQLDGAISQPPNPAETPSASPSRYGLFFSTWFFLMN